MTVSTNEAHAINCVIAYITGKQGYEQSQPPLPTLQQAINALVCLARSANTRLHVGYDAEKARAALNSKWREYPAAVVIDEASADSAAAYLYLRRFLGLSDELPDGTPQDAPVRIGPLRVLLAERHALTARAEAAENAFDDLHVRINRDFNFDAAESASPDDEYWARLMDGLVMFAAEQAEALEARLRGGQKAEDSRHAPHQVTVTHLDADFDLSDKREHELLITDDATGGWISHLVQHPPACHRLKYGEICWFDDEWQNGQYTYDDIGPGVYDVLRRQQDVGDHRGEFSHTESFLDYVRTGDAPERPAVPAAAGGYSGEPPF